MRHMKINQRVFNRYIVPISILLSLLMFLIARLLWPPESGVYADFYNSISGLGDTEDNPIGYIFFQIASCISACLFIPTLLYIHPKLKKLNKPLTYIGSFFFFIGFIGFLLVGVIPDDSIPALNELTGGKFHEVCAILGVVGFLFASFFYFWPMKKDGGDQINQKLLNIRAIIVWSAIILTAVGYGLGVLLYEETYGWCDESWAVAGISPFFSFGLWERVLFGIMFLSIAMTGYIIPNSIES
ncbi:MAG: DUF998 domain-containing protein [Candidatus Lokiarchaeota archaeon]|nr:DUF998 domain-containing protein [Candidatus Lokiarchaeota archaeon]